MDFVHTIILGDLIKEYDQKWLSFELKLSKYIWDGLDFNQYLDCQNFLMKLSKTLETPYEANFLNNSPQIDWTGKFLSLAPPTGMIQRTRRLELHNSDISLDDSINKRFCAWNTFSLVFIFFICTEISSHELLSSPFSKIITSKFKSGDSYNKKSPYRSDTKWKDKRIHLENIFE